MAVQATLKRNRDEAFKLRQQLQDEASKLLSFQTLGTRMSQLDSIIKRRADKVFFSMETDKEDNMQQHKVAEARQRQEKVVKELLLKVKKRRKMIRSYTYLSWFCIFFGSFLGNLSLKEVKVNNLLHCLLLLSLIPIIQDNAHLFAVDLSIQNRIVDILPKGVLSSNSDFYKWFEAVVNDVFEDTVCGNGICELPEEYPGFGRFGCVSDCGRYLQVTPVRIDAISAVKSRFGGIDLATLASSSVDSINVSYSYNIFSETMGDYLLSGDTGRAQTLIDVPDGMLRLEIYQPNIISLDISPGDISQFSLIATSTIMKPVKRYDIQYGDPAEAIAASAALNRQLSQYCASSTACGVGYDPQLMAAYLRNNYGFRGNVSIVKGSDVLRVFSFPFCDLAPSALDSVSGSIVDPTLCVGSNSNISAGVKCYDAKQVSQSFSCKGNYSFEVWSYGPKRSVTVKPVNITKKRTLTPFNYLIGAIVVTQYRRKETSCPRRNSEAIEFLTGQFSCQAQAPGDKPFSIDPVFQATSALYNGKLNMKDFYAENELQGQNVSDGLIHLKTYPFGFYPHQWARGTPKEDQFISPEHTGLYKLFFDSRLSTPQAKKLVQYMKDAFFVDSMTDQVEMEIITFNAEFNVFGIMTIQFKWDKGGAILWDYQYNTAQLSPYAGFRGKLNIALEALFVFMLVVDILRESRDIYFACLREDLYNGYITKFWNWIDWTHYCTMMASICLWIAYNLYIGSLGLKASYPILKNIEAPCRFFETDAKNEFEFIDFTTKMRNLADMKNFITAINCISILLFVVRILKILDFQPRMSLITRTLRMASTDLGHYLSLYSIIFVGYASVGTLLLGDRMQQFQTFGDSCSVLFMIFMGWEPLYRSMIQAASQTKIPATTLVFQVFYWSWVLIASFIMLNIVLAIIVEAYANVKAQMKDAPTIVNESATVCREALQMVGNRLWGKQWFITDKELEKVLIQQNRSLQSQKKLLDTISQIRGKVKAVRLAGGLQVTEQDFANILQGYSTETKSLFFQMKKAMAKPGQEAQPDSLLLEDGVEIMNEDGSKPPPAIANLIKRYGEVVPEGKDDVELLELIRTENMKRQMAMYTTQDQIRQQVDLVVDLLNALAGATLPPDEMERLQTEMLVKRNANGILSLDVGDILNKASKVDGTLNVTVISAKKLPRLDIFSESDPYCVLILEEPSENDPSAPPTQEFLARTETKKNEPNPLWNFEQIFDLTCSSGTKIIAAVLDKDDHGADDLIGTVAVNISELPLGKEVDKWYYLRNDAAPHLTKKAMLRLKLQFSASITQIEGIDGSELKRSNSDQCRRRSTILKPNDELKDDLKWLHDKLNLTVCDEKSGPRILEITVVSARHLPKRDAFFMKLDPYVKIAFNGVEFESEVKHNTYSPDWEQSFRFRVAETSEITEGIHLAVMDWDRLTDHDTVGFAEISAQKTMDILHQELDIRHEHTFHLQRKGKTVTGNDGMKSQVTLAFKVMATPPDPQEPQPADLQNGDNYCTASQGDMTNLSGGSGMFPRLGSVGGLRLRKLSQSGNSLCNGFHSTESDNDIQRTASRESRPGDLQRTASTESREGDAQRTASGDSRPARSAEGGRRAKAKETVVAADVGYEGAQGFVQSTSSKGPSPPPPSESANEEMFDAMEQDFDVEVDMANLSKEITSLMDQLGQVTAAADCKTTATN